MLNVLYLLLFILVSSAIPAQLSAAAKRPVELWNYYHFDGSSFIPGPASDDKAYMAVKEKMRPVVLIPKVSSIEQTALPDGTGAIAGICYQQTSGGKLVSGKSVTPYSRLPLLIYTAGKQFLTVQTDDYGYFVAVLPVGTYSIGSGAFTAEIIVERGTTTLVPLRVGKRMVD